MFCYQCEQTDRSGTTPGCAFVKGNCGKDETTAAVQDVLVDVCLGLGWYAQRCREAGVPDPRFVDAAATAMFTTLTNVNFNPTRLVALVAHTRQLRQEARRRYEAACAAAGTTPVAAPELADVDPGDTLGVIVDRAGAHRVDIALDELGEDVVGLRNLNLYGLKGVCAYVHHAHGLGYHDETVDAGVESALAFLAQRPTDAAALLEHALTLGRVNFGVMELLDAANTGTFGAPEPTLVRMSPVAGKAILVSGHEFGDLLAVLQATEGTGIKVYTNGELLPAHGYPGLKAYPHLAGNYGGAWYQQQQDFAAFPGPIVMTSNCLIEPAPAYRRRIFTMGPVGWPGVRHITRDQLGIVVKAAQALPGFADDAPEVTSMTGFARDAVLGVADTVVEAVKAGQISRFVLIGGCDGAVPGRSYYTDLADALPRDTAILTLGCNKFRFNTHDLGMVAGLPRLLDVGQCSDTYSALRIAMALAEAFDCEVGDLPLSIVLGWFEQKAVAVLLTLLSLGIKGIRIGPSLPAFLTESTVATLVEAFDLRPIGEAAADRDAIMAGR